MRLLVRWVQQRRAHVTLPLAQQVMSHDAQVELLRAKLDQANNKNDVLRENYEMLDTKLTQMEEKAAADARHIAQLQKEELRLKEEIELTKVQIECDNDGDDDADDDDVEVCAFQRNILITFVLVQVQMLLIANKAQALQKQMISADGSSHSTEQQLRQALTAGSCRAASPSHHYF